MQLTNGKSQRGNTHQWGMNTDPTKGNQTLVKITIIVYFSRNIRKRNEFGLVTVKC